MEYCTGISHNIHYIYTSCITVGDVEITAKLTHQFVAVLVIYAVMVCPRR